MLYVLDYTYNIYHFINHYMFMLDSYYSNLLLNSKITNVIQ